MHVTIFFPFKLMHEQDFRRYEVSNLVQETLNPFDPRRPLAKIFFSFSLDFLKILFFRKLSFKSRKLQTFWFLGKNFEDPFHRRFEGYELAAKKLRSFGKSDFLLNFENFYLDFEIFFFNFLFFCVFHHMKCPKWSYFIAKHKI